MWFAVSSVWMNRLQWKQYKELSMQRHFVCSIVLLSALLFVPLSLPAGDNKWTTDGPYGGFFQSFTFHPTINNLIFSSGWINGVFRSRNGGLTWQRLSVNGNNFVVRIHPRDPGTILAASFQVFASTDQGSTWKQVSSLDLPQGDSFSDMEFDPVNPLVLYSVTYQSGVLKSTDGGKTWTPKNTGLHYTCSGHQCGVPQVEIDPRNSKNVYALLPGNTIGKTTDGGDSWKSANRGIDFQCWMGTSIAIDPKNPNVLYAVGCGIFKTTNGGGQWAFIHQASGGGWQIAVDPKDSNILYSTSDQGEKSVDGGKTWKPLAIPAWQLLGIAAHPRINLIFAGAFGEGAFRSQNGGTSWRQVNSGLDAQWINRLAVRIGTSMRFFAVAGTQSLFLSSNGRNWDLASVSKGDNSIGFVRDVQVHPKNPSLVGIGVADGRGAVFLSTDGGNTWQPRAVSYGDSSFFCFDPQNQNVMYLGAYPSNMGGSDPLGIAKSTDQGKSWKLINSGISEKFISSFVVDPRNSSILYAGVQSGKIFKSANGGSSWKNTSNGIPSGGTIPSIVVDPANSSTVYAVAGSRIYKSTNQGGSWSLKSKGISGGANFIQFGFPSHVLFAGGYGGVFVSSDAAETWNAFDTNGLGPFNVMSFLTTPGLPDSYIIGTQRGVFSYTLAGAVGGPRIDQLSPSAGKSGDAITINGRNLGPTQGNSKVFFGSIDAGTAQSWTDTRIQTKVPNGAGTGPVTVTVASRKSNSFEFIALPASGNLSPTSGPSSGGTRVTILAPSGISGTQFNVLFGSTVAGSIRFTPPNIITCTTPPGSGTVDVSVTSSAVVAKVGTFTYQ
jgi:photosystem II stability/assembly factor-like uncharacterized protein